MAQSLLAIEGGPKAVTAPVGDGWENIGPLEKSYVNEVLDDPKKARRHLELFESDFSKLVKTQHAICTCNGTAALHSAIFAAGARVGKEVIVPSVTWHATISPILHCGATPVFCEVDPNAFCAESGRCKATNHRQDMRDCRHTRLRESGGYGWTAGPDRRNRYQAD